MLSRTLAIAMIAFVVSLLTPVEGCAAQRTFVSSGGDDANPCSLILPCRSFATALAATDTGGEIIVVDSAGYGQVAVIKSVSIIAPPGIYAGITTFFGPAIDVESTTAGPVVLRNLTIVGQGGFDGIRYGSADELLLDGVSITGFPQHGILVSHGSAPGNLIVRNSIIEANADGISVDPASGAGAAKINVSGSLFVGNTTAMNLHHNVSASITDSTITGGGIAISLHTDDAGFVECVRCTINKMGNMAIQADLDFGAISSLVVLSKSSITDSAAEAVFASNAAVVRISDTTIAHNATGIAIPSNGGQVISWGNNRLFGNGIDGSFTSVAAMQ